MEQTARCIFQNEPLIAWHGILKTWHLWCKTLNKQWSVTQQPKMSIWCKKQTIEKQPRRKARISLVWTALKTAFDRLTNLIVNILFIETQLFFYFNISMTMIVWDWIVILIFSATYSLISSIYLNLSLLYSICCLLFARIPDPAVLPSHKLNHK